MYPWIIHFESFSIHFGFISHTCNPDTSQRTFALFLQWTGQESTAGPRLKHNKFTLGKFNAGKKNAAKRSRQHTGKRYREYAQRRVCFVNEQVP